MSVERDSGMLHIAVTQEILGSICSIKVGIMNGNVVQFLVLEKKREMGTDNSQTFSNFLKFPQKI